VILPVEFALDTAWKIIGDMTIAMTTAMASLMKWLPPVVCGIVLFAFPSIDQPFDQSTALLMDVC